MLYIIQQINPQKSPLSEPYEICDHIPSTEKDYNKHLFTANCINTTKYKILQQKNPQPTPKFTCDLCNYETGNKKDYTKTIQMILFTFHEFFP